MTFNKVKVGFFSLVHVSRADEHHRYNAWHQYDHLPEQFAIPGIVFGNRWVATPSCQASAAVSAAGFDKMHYVALYLMAEPVDDALREFAFTGERLRRLGRFHPYRRSIRVGALMALDSHSAPDLEVSGESLAWRPSTGIYLVVEQRSPDAEAVAVDEWQRLSTLKWIPELVSQPGVAGAWRFGASSRYRNPAWDTDGHEITLLWLRDDPLEVAARLEPLLRPRWQSHAITPLWAGPLCNIVPGEWTWFDR